MEKEKSQLRILICRPDRIGDVVLSTPIPREIKNRYPDSFIAVMLREYTKDICVNNPYIDEIILYDESIIPGLFIKKLRKFSFTHAFMLLPQEKLNWILFFSGIKYRIGVGYKFYQFISNTKSVFRYKYIPLRHEADYCLDMVRKIGIEPQSIEPEIFLNEEENKAALEFKRNICRNGELLIGINSTSGKSAPNITPGEYRRLIKLLLHTKGIKTIVTDLDPPDELKNIEGVEYPNVNNSLRESLVTFAALDLLISASTGPMHICSALKIKTLSLFSPSTACSPQLWGPLGNESYIIMPSEGYCRIKCSGDPQKCTFDGEGGIDAEKIYKKVLEIIH
ncbi:MAG: glycosyltransferase family 9 protein [Ignavibacteriaceae bacterium]